MASLTETAYFARKGVNLFVILLVLTIIARIIWNLAVGIRDKYFPPPPPPATVAFGKLPFPNAQNNIATPSANVTYTLETVDGQLPQLPTTMRVYFITSAGPSFNSFDKMKAEAAKIEFTGTPVRAGTTSWRFVDTNNPLRLLDIDEISQNFRLTYNYQSDSSVFQAKNFTSVDDVIAQARGFYNSLGILASDLTAGTPQVSYFRFDSGTLVPVNAVADADAISVTLNRANITVSPTEKYAIVSPDARQGLVSILFSSSADPKKKVLDARFFYSPLDLENWATYPLTKSSVAFEQLKSGKAIFASLPAVMPTTISLREVKLAYLDPYPPQRYLQPVLVFSDQKGFVAYVPVVDPAWLQ